MRTFFRGYQWLPFLCLVNADSTVYCLLFIGISFVATIVCMAAAQCDLILQADQKAKMATNSEASRMILKGKAPDNLQVIGTLDLSGTGLTALPDRLQVSGWLELAGCTGLTRAQREQAQAKYWVLG